MSTTQASVTDLGHAIEKLDSSSFENDVERRKALEMARSLCRRLERPTDTMIRIAWMECAAALCLKIALDLGLYQALGQKRSISFSVDELSKSTGAESGLLHRLLRLLAAMNVVKEVDVARYAPTELSMALRDRSINSAIDFRLTLQSKFDKLPAFLQQTGYRDPADVSNGPWQFATQDNLIFFNWLLQNPQDLEIMTSHMSGYTQGRETWDSIYPIQELILDTAESKDDLILVDVGGGTGHDLQRFAAKSGIDDEKTCRLVLQDLPAGIGQASSLPACINTVLFDFFQDAPVPGVRAYYLHSILHDWPDREATTILRNMRPALRRRKDGLKPRLLLNENVLPKTGLKEQIAAQDLYMLMLCSSHERTAKQWEDLLAAAGYRLMGIFSKIHVDEAIIEAELIED